MPNLTPCCGTSVGVLAFDDRGWLLTIERGWFPAGIAPVAGHIADAHTNAADAIRAEVNEESGLRVTGFDVIVDGLWLPNLCASPPAVPLPGHRWTLATATVTGELAPDPVETRGAAWRPLHEVRALLERTLFNAATGASDELMANDPGLEPVWGELLHHAGLVQLRDYERAMLRRLYTTPPPAYWDPVHEREVPAADLAPCS